MNERNADKLPHNCLLRIKAIYGNLKSAEKNAVDFILEHPEEIKGTTIVSLARKARCSEATLVRLARKLGYGGFPELKADFAGLNGSQEGAYDYVGISTADGPIEVMEKVIETTIAALRDSFSIVDREQYVQAVEALVGAPTILFCGVGDAALVAMEACQRFIRIGRNSLVSQDPDVQLIMSSRLRRGDVMVAVSHSGKSRAVVNAAKVAGRAGATVIAITNYPVSPLTKRAEIVLLTAVFSQHVTGEVVSKRVAELCLIESLYINYLLRTGGASLEQLQTSNEVVKINKL